MLLLPSLVAAAAIASVVAWRAIRHAFGKFSKALELAHVHASRRRRITACVGCAQEIRPGLPTDDCSLVVVGRGQSLLFNLWLKSGIVCFSPVAKKLLLRDAAAARTAAASLDWSCVGSTLHHVCSDCTEEWAVCDVCLDQDRQGRFELIFRTSRAPAAAVRSLAALHDQFSKKSHPLRLQREQVVAEVGVEAIEHCTSIPGGAPQAVRACFRAYAHRWLLGNLRHADTFLESLGESKRFVEWLTYDLVSKTADNLHIGLAALTGVRRGDFVAIIGAASPEWYIAYFAAFLHGLPVVPIHASANHSQIAHIVRTCHARIVIASKHVELPSVLLAGLGEFENTFIVTFCDSAARYSTAFTHGLAAPTILSAAKDSSSILSWDAVLECASTMKLSTRSELIALAGSPRDSNSLKDALHEDCGETIRLLLPSSGTTGVPKLVIVTDNMLRQLCIPPRQGTPVAMLSIEPLRQSLDLLAKGGRIGVFTSLDEIRQDLQFINPTVFGSTPAFFSGLMQEFDVELQSFELDSSLPESRREAEARHSLIRQWQARSILGNRCKTVIVGGAVSSAALRNFLFSVLRAVVVDGYGSTETGAVAANGQVHDGIQMMLIDAPDYGYLTSDDPPRGQIVVSTTRMTPGYYGDPTGTAAQFVEIGGRRFARTGDVGRIVDGRIEVIDRVVSLFKLRTGTFVAPSELEALYERSPLVARVFIWGDSSMARVVAAVVLFDSGGSTPATLTGVRAATTAELSALRADFASLASEHGLSAPLVPRSICVDNALWTVESGLVNGAGKPRRAALLTRYRDMLEKLVAADLQLGKDSNEPLEQSSVASSTQKDISLSDSSGLIRGLTVLIAESIQNAPPVSELSLVTTLHELGADSLAFARLVTGARQRFGSKLTLPQLMHCRNLGEVQRVIFGDSPEVEGEKSELFWQEQIEKTSQILQDLIVRADAFKASSTSRSISASKSDSAAAVPVAVLTGACGFLGVFLLAELCDRGWHVLCVVRTQRSSREEAEERVSESLTAHSLHSVRRMKSYAATPRSWRALSGNVAKELFGLSSEDLRLTQGFGSDNQLKVVVHCAAAVGSAAPFESLKPHNIDGAVFAAAFARMHRASLVHISTVGFLPPGLASPAQICVPSDHLGKLGSYVQSKWVAEQVILEGRKRCGLAASVVRVGTCFGATTTGAANTHDSVILLIAGLAQEGVYSEGGRSPLPATFRLAPVDWVAQTIVRRHINSTDADPPIVSCVMATKITPLRDIISALERAGGCVMERVSDDVFRERMARIQDDKHPLFVYSSTLASSGFATDNESDDASAASNHIPPPSLDNVVRWLRDAGHLQKHVSTQ